MTVTDQYRSDHMCGTCMVWFIPAYDYGYCHRNPHCIKKHKHDWCSQHIPDEQAEPTMYDLNDHAYLWYEYAWDPNE